MGQYDALFKKKWVASYEEHRRPRRETRIVTETGTLVLEGWEADLPLELADRIVQEHNNYLDLVKPPKGQKKKGA